MIAFVTLFLGGWSLPDSWGIGRTAQAALNTGVALILPHG